MRWTGVRWVCTVVLVGHIQAAWALGPNNGYKSGMSGKSDYERPSPWNRIFGQKKLGPECPVDHQLCPESVGGGCCPKTRACSTNGCLAVAESAVTVSHPKITEAPVFKRKLGSNKWDMIHEGIQGQKRDATACPADYQLCPASMNGGCCPNDRICGSSSCYATSAAPASACGISGYIGCGIDEGGGCCPQSYSCLVGGCSPSAGVSYSETCGLSSYLCPASVGYGCCKNGFACGLNACYATSITTFTMTETLTTTDASNLPHTVTSTVVTAQTPSIPTAVFTATAIAGVIPKVTPSATAIAKTNPTSSSNGGLTAAQLGGIIGGAIAILIIIIVATVCIIRRLNKIVKAATESQSRTHTSSSGLRSRGHRPRPSNSDIDAMSVDPLMMSASEVSRSVRQPSHPSASHSSSAHEVDAVASPPAFGSPFSPRSPPFSNFGRGYNPVPTSDSASSSGYGRNPSVESTPPLGQNPGGYFDIPTKPDLRDQNLRFGHSTSPRRPSQHERNWSNASDQSQVSQTSSSLAELDAGQDGDRRSSLQRALQGFGMGRIASRRKSSATSPMTLTGGPSGRTEWGGAGPNPRAVGLGHIPEAGESRVKVNEGMGDVQMREIYPHGPQDYGGLMDRRDREKTTEHDIGVLREEDRDYGRS